MSYAHTQSRVLQWIGIILVTGVFAGAYWYFQVRASTLNQSRNDLVTNGLVGLWSFNGDDISDTTAYDRSGSGNNGTLTNGPTKVTGKVGQALNFASASSQYVALGDITALKNSVFTWSAWVNPTTYAGSERSIIGGSSNIARFSVASDGTLTLVQTGVATIGSTTATIPLSTWSHVAVSYDASGNYVFYIDGVSVKTGTNLVTFTFTGANFTIGQVSTNYFNGKIDEVRSYNRVLTAGEIQSLYAQGGGTKVNSSVSNAQGSGRLDSGLAGYWRLDDGSGTSATDSSSGGNTGTLNNGPTWTTGQIGGGLDFDGSDDYVEVAYSSSLVASQSLTYSFWVRPDLNEQAGILGSLNGENGSGYNFITLDNNGSQAGNPEVYFTRNINGSTTSRTVSFPYTVSQWFHYTYTYDGAYERIYVNGNKLLETAQTGNFATNTEYGLILGDPYQAAPGGFDGVMDEVRVYTRALSSDEVAQLYRLTTPTGVDTSLKGYWSFNGQDMNSVAFDRSGAGNTGSLYNSPTIARGILGQALDFDAVNDYVATADSSSLDIGDTDDLTLSGWFYRDTFTGSNGLIAKRSGFATGDVGYIAYIDATTDQLIFQISDGTDVYTITSSSTFTATGWHHFAVVWDQDSATNSEIYIDGTADKATDSGTIGNIGDLSNALGVYVGARSDGSALFDGRIDEARVYKRALSATDIKSLYDQGSADRANSSASQNQGTGRLDSGLAGYWALDDGSGISATDRSTNAATGALTNGPTWTTGQIGGAVTFDNTDDYISIPDSDNLDVGDTDDLTLMGWFNRTATGSADGIVFKRAGTLAANNGYSVHIANTDDKLTFEVSDGTDEYSLASTTTFTSSGWHHFAVVWDQDSPTNSEIYIDGRADNATDTGTIGNIGSIANATVLAIGAATDASLVFNGSLDELRVYRRTLTPGEIAETYRLTTPTGTDNGLKGYWSFNGQDVRSTLAYDRSGAGNDGTLTLGPVPAIGKIGQSLNFDGSDDYVSVNDADSLDIGDTDDLTLVGWFYRDTFTTDDVLMAKRNTTLAASAGYIAYLESTSDKIYFEVSDGTDEYQLVSTATFATAGWNHFAIVWDQDSAANSEIYVNGVADSAVDTGTIGSIGDLSNTRPFGLGVTSLAAGPYDGRIDEMRMYKRALSAAEIAALYNQGR